MSDITPEILRDLLHYAPDSGVFVWKKQVGKRGVVNTIAGSTDKLGYVKIQLFGVKYAAHRLAWLYMTGKWPSNHVDHINGKPSDNRFDNLRDVSRTGNNQNRRRPHKQNKSGFLGVSSKNGRWQADIQVNGMQIYLGIFDTPEDAHNAYVQAKRKFHHTSTL